LTKSRTREAGASQVYISGWARVTWSVGARQRMATVDDECAMLGRAYKVNSWIEETGERERETARRHVLDVPVIARQEDTLVSPVSRSRECSQSGARTRLDWGVDSPLVFMATRWIPTKATRYY